MDFRKLKRGTGLLLIGVYCKITGVRTFRLSTAGVNRRSVTRPAAPDLAGEHAASPAVEEPHTSPSANPEVSTSLA